MVGHLKLLIGQQGQEISITILVLLFCGALLLGFL